MSTQLSLMNIGPRSFFEIFASFYYRACVKFCWGQCQLPKVFQAISILQPSLAIISMSPNQTYYLSIASVIAIVTIALVTAILEVFQILLNLPEDTRAALQSAALIGQVLLLLAQVIEKLHSGLRTTREYQAMQQPGPSCDVSDVSEELEPCIHPALDVRSHDCNTVTPRSLITYHSTQCSISSAEIEDN